MTSKSKILEEIHPLALIREVQRRPALYSRNNAQMASPHYRHKIWSEVAASLFPDWELCSARSKEDKGLMKRWRNLRDTFKRQLEIQKKIREGANIKKKQYVYFKHMSFLTPHMNDDDQEESYAPETLQPANSSQWDHTGWQASPARKRPRVEDATFGGPNDFTEIDEDKHFLLSLVPSFKRMREDEKLTAKMEILKVIKMVKENSASASAMELGYELAGREFSEDVPLVDVKLEALTAVGSPSDRAPDDE